MLKKLILGVLITMSNAHQYTNKLINEESPYLLQHAHNPINWYPWSDEAFEKARREDKLIFLSIGYSTCHWCHVMEKESFENLQLAKYMNKHFVCIKVDREEYPHIDRYYQDVYMLMNKRGGGWPLSIFMTPDKKPFFSATYLPLENRYGRVGMLGITQYLYELYTDQKEKVIKSADSIQKALKSASEKESNLKSINLKSDELSEHFIQSVSQNYDSEYQGIGQEPKFPHAATMETLLNIYRLTDNKKAFEMAENTLEAMAKGGIYDQIEGGFYRYSTDREWMIPHFEKMLYTNAELVELYAEAYKITKNELFQDVVIQTIENINNRFKQRELYYSASDADSDGVEGKYFLFSYDESLNSLVKGGFLKDEAKKILEYLGITPEGNFEGESNPYIKGDTKPKGLDKAKKILFDLRSKKSYPFIDTKIQTSWNALFIKSLLKASFIDQKYLKQALSSLQNLYDKLYINEELYHQVILGKKPKVKGYLEDYSFLISALLEAYDITLDENYLRKAAALNTKAISKFYKNAQWYMSDDSFLSKASAYDASYQSALSVMLENQFILANILENHDMFNFAKNELLKFSTELKSNPFSYATLTRIYLGYSYGYVLLKGRKEQLLENEKVIKSLKYPFVLKKSISESRFMACKIDRCFAIDENIEKVLSKIE